MHERYTLSQMANIWSEENKFSTMLQIEILACEAQAKLGNIPEEALKEIKLKANFSINRIKEIEEEVNHDVIAFLTNVAEYVGKSSRYIHLGLTSSDVLDTCLAVLMREAGAIILEDLYHLKDELMKKALEHKNTLMIGRTHGVHAEPITFGLKIAIWYCETERNIKRLTDAITNISFGKLSGAVGTYAHIDPFVEEYVCKKLSLEVDPVSTQIIQRDRHAQYISTLAIIASSLEKFAQEIRNLQRTDINEVEEYFSPTQKGSSAMPHKKNPITAERICGLARVVRSKSQVAMENIPLWHERDITHSSSERMIIPDSTSLLDYMIKKFTHIISNLVVNKTIMMNNIMRTHGLIFSQKLLLALIEKGVTREEAYLLVQRNTERILAENKSFKELLLKDQKVLALLSPQGIEACFDLNAYIKNIDFIYKRLGLI